MVILNGGVAALAVDVGGKHLHRSRSIKRNHGDDLFNVADANPANEFPHSTAFHLEDAHRIGPTEQFVRGGIIQRDPLHIELDATAFLD